MSSAQNQNKTSSSFYFYIGVIIIFVLIAFFYMFWMSPKQTVTGPAIGGGLTGPAIGGGQLETPTINQSAVWESQLFKRSGDHQPSQYRSQKILFS